MNTRLQEVTKSRCEKVENAFIYNKTSLFNFVIISIIWVSGQIYVKKFESFNVIVLFNLWIYVGKCKLLIRFHVERWVYEKDLVREKRRSYM